MTILMNALCGHEVSVEPTDSRTVNRWRIEHTQQCRCLCERCSEKEVKTA